MSRPCDYGMCNRNCIEWDTCTEPLPQYPKYVAPLPSLSLPQKINKKERRWSYEDVIFIQFTNESIRVVSSDSRSSNQTV